LAASRNDRVIGRTVILIVSIKIKNGLSHVGAPSGKRCAIKDLGLCNILETIMVSHKGNPNVNVKIKCEDRLIEYGFNPIKLTRINNINKDEISVVSPLR
jgi:hypothetical protein